MSFANPPIDIDCADPKDNKFLALAIDASAALIVSGDAHLRVLHPYRGIMIRSAAEFLESRPETLLGRG